MVCTAVDLNCDIGLLLVTGTVAVLAAPRKPFCQYILISSYGVCYSKLSGIARW